MNQRSLIQHFEADILWKVRLKILNSGIILKTLTHVSVKMNLLSEKHKSNITHKDLFLSDKKWLPDIAFNYQYTNIDNVHIFHSIFIGFCLIYIRRIDGVK